MIDKPRLFSFGELNPIDKPRMKQRATPSGLHRSDLLSTIREATYETMYGIDSLSRTGPYYAIVLKVIDNTNKDRLPMNSAFFKYISAFGDYGGEQRIKIVKARIPELHAHIPDPFSIDIGRKENLVKYHNLIEAHPTFVGELDSDLVEGQLVMVDFQNRANQEGPILISSLPGVGSGPMITEGPRSSFDSINGTFQAESPQGGVMGSGRTNPESYLPTPKQGGQTGQFLQSIQPTPAEKIREEIKKLPKYSDKLPEQVKLNMMQTYEFARIVELFWKQLYPSAKLYVRSCIRGFSNGTGVSNSTHGYGLAADVDVHVDGRGLPVDIVYVGYLKLIEANILPKGGLGIYVNVKDWKGWGGPPSRSKGKHPYAPGGSSWIHYDWRGYRPPHGDSGYSGGRPGDRWVWVDTNGDGSDDFGDSSGPPVVKKRDFFKQWPEVYDLRFTDKWKTDPRYKQFVPEVK